MQKKIIVMANKNKVKHDEAAVVIGAGIAGLSCAFKLAELGYEVIVLEHSDNIGGLAATFQYKDFLLDYGPHKIYTQLPIMKEFRELMGDKLVEVTKKSHIRLQEKFIQFPVQMKEVLLSLNPLTSVALGLSYAVSLIKSKSDDSYEDYLLTRFGNKTYKLLFKPYAEKVWGNPKLLSADMAKSRVAGAPSLFEVAKRAIFGDRGKAELSAKTFFYPKHGVLEMSKMFAEKLQEFNGKIILNTTVTSININQNKVSAINYAQNGKTQKIIPDIIVSTIPLTALLTLTSPIPEESLAVAKTLQHRDLVLVYLFVDKPRLFDDNWLFFPEKKYIFNRISEQKGFSQFMTPADKTVLCCEVTNNEEGFLQKSDEEITERVIADLENIGILSKSEIVDILVKRIPRLYQIYELNYKNKLEVIFAPIDRVTNLYSIGRQGAFSYCGTMDCIDMSFKTAHLINAKRPRAEWIALRKTFQEYSVLD